MKRVVVVFTCLILLLIVTTCGEKDATPETTKATREPAQTTEPTHEPILWVWESGF